MILVNRILLNRLFRWKTTNLHTLCFMIGCLAFDQAGACTMPSAQTSILFSFIPEGLDEPVIAEVTIFSEEADITFPNHAQLAVMNARVERVIRGTLDSGTIKVVTYLNSCTRVGVGHGFVAGRLEHDAQRGLELIAAQRTFGELAGQVNSDSLRRNSK
jgi:hypothetical protein